MASGGNALTAVEATCKKKTADPDADELWCVCDIDDTSSNDVAKAVSLAEKEGINLCLSRRSFEVWLALHWGKISTAEVMTEKQARSLVAAHFPSYAKGTKVVPFELLFPLTLAAIDNARWLGQQGLENPSTSVHRLVEKLVEAAS